MEVIQLDSLDSLQETAVKRKRKFSRQPNFLNSREILSVMENKIVYLLLNQLYQQPEEDANRYFTILSSDISTNTQRINEALYRLQRRIYVEMEGDIKRDTYQPFGRITYHKFKGLITIEIREEAIKKYRNMSRGYSSFELESSLLLTSKYAQKLYVFLSRWKDKKELTINVADLQRELGAETKEYGQFKKTCITPVLKEINEKTEITCTIKEVKQGRRVVSLTLCSIDKNKERKAAVIQETNRDFEIIEEMSPGEIAQHIHTTFLEYSFAQWQRDALMADRQLFRHFIKIHNLIKGGLVKVQTTPTRYVASILFKKFKSA